MASVQFDPEAADLLDGVARVWEAQAQADPLWAVLSEPDRRGRRWDLQAFMATGREQVAATLARFDALGAERTSRQLAVDFGSGVGRLTQPLADYFEHVIGVDISPTMVGVARALNRQGGLVEYRVNDRPDLSFLPDGSASLIMSHITLQHMPPEVARRYIREFLRIVKPNGLVVFQLPSHFTDDYLPADRDDLPVAPSARCADFRILDCPWRISAGAESTVVLEVINASDSDWTQSSEYVLSLGNHWETINGMPIVQDDGRARLPGRLRAGQSAHFVLGVRAPRIPGLYRLVVDVVQEGVAWFSDANSKPAYQPVWVSSPLRGETNRENPERIAYGAVDLGDAIGTEYFDAPQFEMHGIERSEIESLLAEHGAVLLGVDEWITEWYSYTYYIRAAP